MFGRKKEEEVAVAPATVSQPVSVETYAVSTGADRLRALEAEIVSAFEEWMKAQKSSAEKQVLVEFHMTPWLAAAWSSWKGHQFTSVSEAETGVIPKPDKWPE